MVEKKKDVIFCIMIVIVMLFCLFMMSKDYFTYLVQRDSLQICDVVIKDMKYIGHDGDRWAYFDFKDDNISIQGRVMSNWWEKEGDTITIAYNQDYRFIRTEITYLDSEIFMFAFCIIMSIVMFIRFKKIM